MEMSSRAASPHQSPTLQLAVCPWCDGAGVEFNSDAGVEPCGVCEGGRCAPVAGDLGPTHTHKSRPFTYNPGLRVLSVKRGGKRDLYDVTEFVPDLDAGQPARAFAFCKRRDNTVHHLYVCGASVSCDCAGSVYGATAKANWRAYWAGRDQYPTAGCVHADALRVLLGAGLLDVSAATTKGV